MKPNKERRESKTMCADIRDIIESRTRDCHLAAIRFARRWLVATGRGDSFARAKKLVNDITTRKPWTF